MTDIQESKELALHYLKTLVEVARESFLTLDPSLRVVSANPVFYSAFQVDPGETEGKLLYELGNGQWNIVDLRRLMEEILPQSKVVKDFEVTHSFETIGKKTMVLNARQIDTVQLIILAIEDVTEKKTLEEKLAAYTKGLEGEVAQQTIDLQDKVQELETTNSSMVDRELKMVELKKENETLRQAQDKS